MHKKNHPSQGLTEWWHPTIYGMQSIIHALMPNKCHQLVIKMGPDVYAWWRHQMETFSAILALCAWNSPVTGEFPTQRPVTRNFDVFFDLRLNEWLSKQWRGWWFETPSRPLWRHCNVRCRFFDHNLRLGEIAFCCNSAPDYHIATSFTCDSITPQSRLLLDLYSDHSMGVLLDT